MHADVGRDAAALADVAFPTGVIPVAATRDIGQIDIIFLPFRPVFHFRLQLPYLVVQTQLQYRVGLVSGLLLQFEQVIDVVWIKHNRFLANHVAAKAQTVADEGVVRVVRRTD